MWEYISPWAHPSLSAHPFAAPWLGTGGSGHWVIPGCICPNVSKDDRESWDVSEPDLDVFVQTWCNKYFHTGDFFISPCIWNFSGSVSSKKSLALLTRSALHPSMLFCIFNSLNDIEMQEVGPKHGPLFFYTWDFWLPGFYYFKFTFKASSWQYIWRVWKYLLKPISAAWLISIHFLTGNIWNGFATLSSEGDVLCHGSSCLRQWQCIHRNHWHSSMFLHCKYKQTTKSLTVFHNEFMRCTWQISPINGKEAVSEALVNWWKNTLKEIGNVALLLDSHT